MPYLLQGILTGSPAIHPKPCFSKRSFQNLPYRALLVFGCASHHLRPEIPEHVSSGLRRLANAFMALVLLQIGLGALVAGLRAGRAFNTWPLIDGSFLPPLEKLTLLQPVWRNFLDNMLLVQLQHRMVAYALLAMALLQALYTWRRAGAGRALRRANALVGLVAAQVAIGIATLVLVVPLAAGLLHQAFAMIVLGMAAVHAQALTQRR